MRRVLKPLFTFSSPVVVSPSSSSRVAAVEDRVIARLIDFSGPHNSLRRSVIRIVRFEPPGTLLSEHFVP